MPAVITHFDTPVSPVDESRRSISALLSPLDKIAADSPNLVIRHTGSFEIAGERYELPSYVFIGPESGRPPVRLAFFAGLHGNELEGSLALIFLTQLLDARPELVRGYCLFFYPLCNPTGYEDETYLSRHGGDLNREFWNGSSAPEVRVLEGEIKSQDFDGIITLHSNQTKNHFFAVSPHSVVTDQLVKPACQAVDKFCTQTEARPVFNIGVRFPRAHAGALHLPPNSDGIAFEITLDAPKAEAAWLLAAILSVLKEHQKLTFNQ